MRLGVNDERGAEDVHWHLRPLPLPLRVCGPELLAASRWTLILHTEPSTEYLYSAL